MRKNKLVAGLVVLLAIVLIPVASLSKAGTKKEDKQETIVLSSDNTIVLNTEVNGDSVAKVIADAKRLDQQMSGVSEKYAGKKPLYLFLNTPGGSIQAGLELIEAINGLGRPVHTITLFAASMGFQIAQNLNDRLILKNGILMSHHAAGGFEGQFGGVSPSQVDSRYQLWLDRIKELDEQTVRRTNGKQTYESYTKAYDHEMWLTGARAIEGGYADRIVLVKCNSSLSGTTEHTASFLGIPITYELDNCPINTSPLNVKIGANAGPISDEFARHVKEQFSTQFMALHKKEIPMY
jgi:ATP-dependent Clp protease protease subunit